jgi:hypothetical protein
VVVIIVCYEYIQSTAFDKVIERARTDFRLWLVFGPTTVGLRKQKWHHQDHLHHCFEVRHHQEHLSTPRRNRHLSLEV